jgi:hypothetical protein
MRVNARVEFSGGGAIVRCRCRAAQPKACLPRVEWRIPGERHDAEDATEPMADYEHLTTHMERHGEREEVSMCKGQRVRSWWGGMGSRSVWGPIEGVPGR